MIELIVAALIQLGTLTTDATATQPTGTPAATTTTTESAPGGTGTWDDNA